MKIVQSLLKQSSAKEVGLQNIVGQEFNTKALRTAVRDNLPALLIGETGTGKTSIVQELAKEAGQMLTRINLTGQTGVDEFLGKWTIKNNETVWSDGVLIQAMKNGHWLLIDEINAALPEILFTLHSLLDDDKKVLLAEKDGEVVTPKETFRLFATMNPVDEYAGTKELNKAFLSRFACVLRFEFLEPTAESRLLQTRTQLNYIQADLLVAFGNYIRIKKLDQELFYTCSTRDLIHWAHLVNEFGMEDAFRVAILNRATADDQKILLEAYKDQIGPVEEVIKQGGKGAKEIMGEIMNLHKTLASVRDEIVSERRKLDSLKDTVKAQIIKELSLDIISTRVGELVNKGA